MDGVLWDSPFRCDGCGLSSTSIRNPADLASSGVANGVCRAVLDRIRGSSGFENLIQIAPHRLRPGWWMPTGTGKRAKKRENGRSRAPAARACGAPSFYCFKFTELLNKN